MRARGAALVMLCSLAVGCSSSRWSSIPSDPTTAVRRAAGELATSEGATFSGSLSNMRGRTEVLVTGSVDLRLRRAIVITTPAPGTPAFPSFEIRSVDNWTYIEIGRGFTRPPTIAAATTWVAFPPGPLPRVTPIPAPRSMVPTSPFTLIDALRSAPFDALNVIERRRDLLRVGVRPRGTLSGSVIAVTVDAQGHIAKLESTDKYGQESVLMFERLQTPPEITAPAGNDVQRFAPGEDPYASG